MKRRDYARSEEINKMMYDCPQCGGNIDCICKAPDPAQSAPKSVDVFEIADLFERVKRFLIETELYRPEDTIHAVALAKQVDAAALRTAQLERESESFQFDYEYEKQRRVAAESALVDAKLRIAEMEK